MRVSRICALICGFAALVAVLGAEGRADQAGLKQLLDGVTTIAAPGIPGNVCVFGDSAFPVVVGKSGADFEAVAAAGTLGRGRVFVLGHNGYLSAGCLAVADTGKLFVNAVRWAAGGAPPRVAVFRLDDLPAYLTKSGFEASAIDGVGWSSKLKSYNVLIYEATSTSEPADLAAIASFVRSGGGVITASTGWGWQQLNPGKSLSADHEGNRLFAPAGIVWGDGMLDRTAAEGFAAGQTPPDTINASQALSALEAHAAGTAPLAKEELAQVSQVVLQAARAIPETDPLLMPRLRRLMEQHAAEAVPSEAKPVTLAQPLARLALTLQLQELAKLPPEKIRAHPAAANFPGAVPADAPRVTRTLDIDTAVPDWHSTGLYAAPGEVIEVDAGAAAGKGLALRIGAHSDSLWHLDSWRRAPVICTEQAISRPKSRFANAFGGPMYVVVPANCKLGVVKLTVTGAVEAPYFILGKTDPTQWRRDIRNLPGPWAELQGSRVIITVPSANVRGLDDPVSLMEFWDHYLDSCAELAVRPIERERQERYVTDMQISAGYMHSGYPVMTFLDVAPLVVDWKKLMAQGSWGHFHEMGHNHQSSDWTFDGTVEVTVNLFSVYGMEKVCGIFQGGHPAIVPEERARHTKAYFAAGPDFKKWCSDPFLALFMYLQLKEAFGWDAYKRVFAVYRALPDAERPKSDDGKRDQWMVRFSRVIGRNLGPFFQTWGVPTSEKARASIADLPVWMPEDFPPK